MIDLRPCPSCRRHVALVEVACVFCGVALAPATPRVFPIKNRSRAAVFAAGAIVASACGGKPAPHDAAPIARAIDARATDAPPPVDAMIDAPPPIDAMIDAGPDLKKLEDAKRHRAELLRKQEELERRRQSCCKPYGAPPARRRIV